MSGHASHLAVASLIEGDFQPAGGYGFAFADRRVARPQPGRFSDPLNTCGQGRTIVERDAGAQRGQRIFRWQAFNLNVVNFTGALAGLSQRSLQRAIVGQHQQAFAIAVKTTRGVDPGDGNKIFQRAAPGFVRKLRQHIVGFIEQDHAFWRVFFALSGDLL